MEELLDILTELHPDIDFKTQDHLIDQSILDSFDIVTLIAEISDTFEVDIPAKQIIPENFNSAEAMYKLISSLK